MMNNISRLITEDWNRFFFAYDHNPGNKNPLLKIAIFFNNPNMWFIVFYRLESALFNHSWFILRLLGYLLYPVYFYFNYFFLAIVIHPKVQIGQGLYLHYRGIIISQTTIAGQNLSLIGPLTIGTDLDGDKSAQIGNNVTICTGAKVIGNVKIGNNVIIGANAVVVKDVPSNVSVGGVPAKILKRNYGK